MPAMPAKPRPKPPQMVARSRKQRVNATPPEQIVWTVLRGRRLDGLKFRRQEAIGPYVVDFCCRERKLVVELDGASHEDKVNCDRQREQWLRGQGFRILRVTSADINEDCEAVVRAIAHAASVVVE